MPLKELAVHSPGLGHRIRQLLLEAQRRGSGPATQLALAKAAGVSRQTLSNVLASDRVTPGAAALLAKAFKVPLEQVAPELAGAVRVAEVASGYGVVPLNNQKIRVFLADLRAELTRAGAEEDEIEAAVRLVTAPEVFTYYSGGKPREFAEAETLLGMRAIVDGVIRPRLKRKKP